MTTSPTTLLRAANLAFPGRQWQICEIDEGVFSVIADWCNLDKRADFDPHDPTKGDLAALNEALEKHGWTFWFRKSAEEFRANHLTDDGYVYVEGKTPAERALKCVEAML